jgi:phosphoglycolate phosphatase
MLLLFDIDGTLVDTGGAGLRALQEASERIFGHSGPPLDLAGSTDLGVVAHIYKHFGQVPGEQDIRTYFTTYLERLEWHLESGSFEGRVLAGVTELLEALFKQPSITLGLLTGNTAAGAAAKMRHFGLDRFFAFGAHGCDHADRNQLGPIAQKRATLHTGRVFDSGTTLVIGDTPKDIACAHAIGARCLAVATGRFSVAELQEHSPARVVPTLEGTLEWIMGLAGEAPGFSRLDELKG